MRWLNVHWRVGRALGRVFRRKKNGCAREKALINASGFFDRDYYLKTYTDVHLQGADPLEHFVKYGALEGRNPSLVFDTRYYLSQYPDIAVARVNPLVHYLRFGRREGRSIRPVTARAPRPTAPRTDDWEQLAATHSQRRATEPLVDVILPVFGGFHESLNSIFHVLSSDCSTPAELVVIDDCSPIPALSDALRWLADLGLLRLLENEENLGFAESVNRGIPLHSQRDVVLLNADTEVYADWLDRLRGAAYSEPTIGTVTPLSNNATICSYPYFCADNDMEFEIPFATLDALARRVNANRYVEAPTGVGFCMYVRRDCLEDVGLFDGQTFKAGYAEENDFCLRGSERNWKHLISGNVFVRHFGRASFGNRGDELLQDAMRTLSYKYPAYSQTVARYIRQDPVKPLRRALDTARLERAAGKHAILLVGHNWGGGTERHIQDMKRLLEREGVSVFVLRPVDGENKAVLTHGRLGDLPNIAPIDVPQGLQDLASLLRGANIRHVHVHHFLGYGPDAPDWIRLACKHAEVSYDCSIHDYTVVCPRVHMIDETGIFCGKGQLVACEQCVARNGSPFGEVVMGQWRKRFAKFLRHARRVFVFDEDTRDRLRQFYPELEVYLRPHPETFPRTVTQPSAPTTREALRVAVLGAIGPHKGSKVLRRCAQDAMERRLNLEYVVFGITNESKLDRMSNVRVKGRYRDEEIFELLQADQCQVALFLSVWPETYSYTLSIALMAGLYPVAFDLGAIAARIRRTDWGKLLPLSLVECPGLINDELLNCTEVSAPPEKEAILSGGRYPRILRDYYGFADEEFSTPVGS